MSPRRSSQARRDHRAAESAVEAFKQAAERAPVLDRLAGRVDIAVCCASYGWLNLQELN